MTAAVSAFVLHTRPYRETSVICEFFTRERGRVGAVAHGVRGSRRRIALPSFSPLVVVLGGRGELATVRSAEASSSRWFEGAALASGMYLNELLVRLLPREDAHEALFDRYAATLERLDGPSFDTALRRFEQGLLAELGYGVRYDVDAHGAAIASALRYRLDAEMGFAVADDGEFSGAVLLSIARDDYTAPGARRSARVVFGRLLAPHLEGRPLRSRSLLGPGAGRVARGADDDSAGRGEPGGHG